MSINHKHLLSLLKIPLHILWQVHQTRFIDNFRIVYGYILIHIHYLINVINFLVTNNKRGRRGRDRMVVGFTTTFAISVYHHWSCDFESRSGEVYLIQPYVINFVSDLRHVGGFLRALRFLPPIILTPRYSWNIVESDVK